MKKSIVIILLICSGILVSCTTNVQSREPVSYDPSSVTIKQTKNYTIQKLTIDKKAFYYYRIVDNKGALVCDDVALPEPVFGYVTNDLLYQEWDAGDVIQYRFFDLKTGVGSPIYDHPILIGYGKVAYMTFEGGQMKLIVSDMFDAGIFYKEYVRDFSPGAVPCYLLIDAKLINQNKLEVTYLAGPDYKEVTETIVLK